MAKTKPIPIHHLKKAAVRGMPAPRWNDGAKVRPSKAGDDRYTHCMTEDMEYTDYELEFFRAVAKFKTDKHDPFPTLRDLLRIIVGLGYRKGEQFRKGDS